MALSVDPIVPTSGDLTLLGDPKHVPAGVAAEDFYDSENPLVPGRTCGTCTLCCKVYSLVELNKPSGTLCVHVAAGQGCTLRERRPHVCRKFFCGWRLDPNLGPEWKPEISGFVLHIAREFWALILTVDPDRPLAWKQEPYYSSLKEWSGRAFEENKKIVVKVGDQATVVLPDCDVPVGELAPGDEIVVHRAGHAYHAERRPARL